MSSDILLATTGKSGQDAPVKPRGWVFVPITFIRKYVMLLAVLGIALWPGGARAGDSDAGIVWYTPEIAADAPAHDAAQDTVVYEEALAAPSTTPQPDDHCSLAQSPYMLAWLATGAKLHTDRPRIVIVIDDMGVDKKRTARMARLPHRLTLAFLPYAHNVQKQVDVAAGMGHEIMMHVPMQPEDDTVNPGPNVLRSDVARDDLAARITANLDAFQGYHGINNHMGSHFTQNRAGMDMLMAELKRRELFFLDSKTHPRSVGGQAAMAAGVMTAGRDVFIDHVATSAGVSKALQDVERYARQHGAAIAIGHPKDVTIDGLAAWLPTLQAKGFETVTLAKLLKERQQQVMQAVHHTPTTGVSAQP